MEIIQQALSLFHKGGLVMYPLLACSLLVSAIAVERWLYFKREDGDTAALQQDLQTCLAQGDWTAALVACRQYTGCVAGVAQSAVERRQRGAAVVESTLEATAALRAAKLRDRLPYLEFVVTLAPLLGLLGTVIGMIQSFSVMNLGEGQPLAITGGVGEALVATAAGLCVAVLALVVYTYFSRRLDSLVTDMEEIGYYLLDAVRGDVNETA